MSIDNNDLLTLLTGRKVLISGCEAAEHGDNSGCLCALKGSVQTIAKKRQSFFVGTPTWYLEESNKTVRLSEVTLLVEDK